MNTPVKLQLNLHGKDWQAQFKPMATMDIIPINAEENITFHHLELTQHGLKEVILQHGCHSLNMPQVMSIMGIEDSRYANEGIHKITISTTLGLNEEINHIEAKAEFETLLNTIRHAGWERTIYPTQPRLAGYDAFLYAQMHDINYSIDAEYSLPVDEWMLLENQSKWIFYANGLYMTVTLMRENKDAQSKAGYFVSIDVMCRSAFQRKQCHHYDENINIELQLQEEQKLMQEIRHQKEQSIIMQGEFRLDEHFISPDDHT